MIRIFRKYWDKKMKYTIILVVVFSTAMITFKSELTLLGFVSLICSLIVNIGVFYLYSVEKERNNGRKE